MEDISFSLSPIIDWPFKAWFIWIYFLIQSLRYWAHRLTPVSGLISLDLITDSLRDSNFCKKKESLKKTKYLNVEQKIKDQIIVIGEMISQKIWKVFFSGNVNTGILKSMYILS